MSEDNVATDDLLAIEWRNVGEHEWPGGGGTCIRGCKWEYRGEGKYVLPACPSKREYRYVSEWIPEDE